MNTNRPELPGHKSQVPAISQAHPPASNSGIEVSQSKYTTGYTTGYSDQVEKGSLLDYWRVLSNRKGTLIAFTLAGTLMGVLFTLVQSPLYRAHTSLEIEDVNREFLNMKQVSPVDDSSANNSLTDLQTQLKILQSETLVERTLDKLDIGSLAALNPRTAKLTAWPEAKTGSTKNQLIEFAAKKLQISVAGQTRLIEVVFQSTDPKIAAAFANTLISEFIDQNMQARGQMSQRTSAWLADQLNDLRNTLQHSEDALQEYARQNSLLYTADKENVSTEKLRQLQAQVSQAQGDLALKESRFKTAGTATPDTLPDVLNDASLRALRNKITELKSQEATLATTFKPEYSKSQKTRAEIASLESALERERGEIVTRITNDYMEAEHREALLADAYNNQVKLVMRDSQKFIQYDILKREVDSNRQIYEAMLGRVKESSIASALKASNIRIIDPARTPEKPFKPSLPIDAAAGLFGGVFAGMVIVVVGQRSDRKLRQPGDAGRLLGLPELGVVPRLGINKIPLNNASAQPATLNLNRANPVNAGTAAWQNMAIELADSFRSVLASIIFSQNKGVHGVLVISSAGPNEGKTTTTTNLALALARIGRRVLVIDGDIRKPSVHKAFAISNLFGLTDLMNQEPMDPLAANSALHEIESLNLQVLTSGPALQSGCDLLFTKAMPRLIAHFKSQFDIILIDTPPLLHMPDARVLGQMADGVVLVTRAGRTLREAAIAACERLSQDQTPVLGVILNDWNPKSSHDGYYGNYSAAVLKRYNSPK